MKKYPLSFIFAFEMITLFGGIVLWRFLDYFDIINDKLSPILGGILGVFGFLGLFFIFKLVDCLEKCLIYGHIRRFAD